MAAGTVKVRGLKELDRALGAYSKDVRKRMRGELKVVAEPVRDTAEQLAVGNITNVGAVWSRMRIGVTSRAVYVAPKARRKGGAAASRRNLGVLLMDRAMQPALSSNTDEVVNGLEKLLDRIKF